MVARSVKTRGELPIRRKLGIVKKARQGRKGGSHLWRMCQTKKNRYDGFCPSRAKGGSDVCQKKEVLTEERGKLNSKKKRAKRVEGGGIGF